MSERVYTIRMDGDAWCAINEDFVNLQESVYGFGDHPLDALSTLMAEEAFLRLRQEGKV